ncbi:hypothetical protein D3C86_2245020 [compost metagenome]
MIPIITATVGVICATSASEVPVTENSPRPMASATSIARFEATVLTTRNTMAAPIDIAKISST